MTFENIVAKGEIAQNVQFLLFPQCFLLYQKLKPIFVHALYIFPQMLSERNTLKIVYQGKG